MSPDNSVITLYNQLNREPEEERDRYDEIMDDKMTEER